MKLMWYILRQNRRAIVLAIVVSFITGIGSASLIALISQQLTGQAPLTFEFIGYFVGLVLIVLFLELIAKWLLIRLTAWNSFHLRMYLAQQIMVMPLHKIEEVGSPRLLALLTEDVRTISLAFNQIPAICLSLAILGACSLYLAWLSPLTFSVLFLVAIPIALGQRILQQRSSRLLREGLDWRDQIFDHFEALTKGIKELKLHQPRRQSFWDRLLEPSNKAVQDKLIVGQTWLEVAMTWSQMLYFIFILGLFILGTITDTNIEVLTGFALVALYMKTYVNRFLSALPRWIQAGVTLNKIESMGLSLEATDIELNLPQPTTSSPIYIEMKGVVHTYANDLDDSHFTLGPIDLRLTSGEIIFLTGGNGSGKTTLIKVLTSLYTPEVGQIILNDTPVNIQNREYYRQHFTLIFSDFYIFEQLLGLEKSTLDNEAYNYLKKLQLEHKVSIKEGHISTTKLSMGQRKRLALLTAYLEDRPIYIFDEWAAGQDPIFKELFYRQLLPELKERKKLIIVISHDEHYFDVADRIIKLEYGQIEEN